MADDPSYLCDDGGNYMCDGVGVLRGRGGVMASGAKLLIATPVRASDPMCAQVSLGYSESVRLVSHLFGADVFMAFGCDVVRARNRVTARALRDYDFTHLLWWDDDMWPADVTVIERMIAKGRDLISCPYTNKKEPVRWILHTEEVKPTEDPEVSTVLGVGLGFALCSRSMLERMSRAPDVVRYTDRPHDDVLPNIFGMLYEQVRGELQLTSEDYSFCRRWRDLGGTVDLYQGKGNLMLHAGAKAWSGRDIEGGVR